MYKHFLLLIFNSMLYWLGFFITWSHSSNPIIGNDPDGYLCLHANVACPEYNYMASTREEGCIDMLNLSISRRYKNSIIVTVVCVSSFIAFTGSNRLWH